MELRHLRYFVAVAEKLNFTKAAESLHLAQPSLTRQILNLEEEIGVRLLNRTKSHVELTEEGRSFLVDARRLLALAVESVQAVQRLSRGETGQLNIAYLSNFNFDLLPKTLGSFRQAFPHIALNLFDMTPAEQFRALEARKIDLSFAGLRYEGAPRDLQWELITRHKVVAVLPKSDPLARKPRLRIEDLRQSRFVALSERTQPGFREWLKKLCAEGGFAPEIVQDAESDLGVLTLVAEGLGITLAREQISRLPHSGVTFHPITPSMGTDYWIVWHRDSQSKALGEFVKTMKRFVPAPKVGLSS